MGERGRRLMLGGGDYSDYVHSSRPASNGWRAGRMEREVGGIVRV